MLELLGVIATAIAMLFASAIELIAGLFIEGAAAFGAIDLALIFFMFIIELCMWLILGIVELFKALLRWGKPRRILKPKYWRPKANKEEEK